MSRSRAVIGVFCAGLLALVVVSVVVLARGEDAGTGSTLVASQRAGLVPGALQGREAARVLRGRLGRSLREHGAAVGTLERVLTSDPSAYLTPGGVVFAHAGTSVESGTTAKGVRPSAPPTPDRVTAAGMPVHHSLQGAPNVLFLDFDGVAGHAVDIGGS